MHFYYTLLLKHWVPALSCLLIMVWPLTLLCLAALTSGVVQVINHHIKHFK